MIALMGLFMVVGAGSRISSAYHQPAIKGRRGCLLPASSLFSCCDVVVGVAVIGGSDDLGLGAGLHIFGYCDSQQERSKYELDERARVSEDCQKHQPSIVLYLGRGYPSAKGGKSWSFSQATILRCRSRKEAQGREPIKT